MTPLYFTASTEPLPPGFSYRQAQDQGKCTPNYTLVFPQVRGPVSNAAVCDPPKYLSTGHTQSDLPKRTGPGIEGIG